MFLYITILLYFLIGLFSWYSVPEDPSLTSSFFCVFSLLSELGTKSLFCFSLPFVVARYRYPVETVMIRKVRVTLVLYI
jgi:hypothetical protein